VIRGGLFHLPVTQEPWWLLALTFALSAGDAFEAPSGGRFSQSGQARRYCCGIRVERHRLQFCSCRRSCFGRPCDCRIRRSSCVRCQRNLVRRRGDMIRPTVSTAIANAATIIQTSVNKTNLRRSTTSPTEPAIGARRKKEERPLSESKLHRRDQLQRRPSAMPHPRFA
jgi:hypothetical protein